MRHALRLALAAAALVAVAVPAAPASAILCDPLIRPICTTLCEIQMELGGGCPRR